jgi:hypothetical protein
MIWLKWASLVLAVFLLAGAGAVAFGAWLWLLDSQALLARLEAARSPHVTRRYDAAGELEGLPEPVQRYFRTALTDGQPMVEAVSLSQAGQMNMSEAGENWRPFTARQRVITQRPGFDWNARIVLFPGVPVQIHDAYVAGTGMLRGAVFGLIPVVNLAGTPEMARGELLRFFAEAVWYPTALLPSQGIRWQAVGERSARATLTDGPLVLTLLFTFNDDGLVAGIRAEARDRIVNGETSSLPWQGRFSAYAVKDGMRVPLQGEVAWVFERGEKTYWRGTTTSLQYEFAK